MSWLRKRWILFTHPHANIVFEGAVHIGPGFSLYIPHRGSLVVGPGVDLVGIDVGFEVSKSFYELSFGEPRWRPSPLQARLAASGRLAR